MRLKYFFLSRWQTLIQSYRNRLDNSILESTHVIMFFGAPHGGLQADDLEEIVDIGAGCVQRRDLIMQLREGSEFLETQREDLINVWKDFKGKIVSFFETVKTPSVIKVITMSCLDSVA